MFKRIVSQLVKTVPFFNRNVNNPQAEIKITQSAKLKYQEVINQYSLFLLINIHFLTLYMQSLKNLGGEAINNTLDQATANKLRLNDMSVLLSKDIKELSLEQVELVAREFTFQPKLYNSTIKSQYLSSKHAALPYWQVIF